MIKKQSYYVLMTPRLVLDTFKLSNSIPIQIYWGVYLAKEGFTEEVNISLDGPVYKDLHQEVINNINIIIP